MTQIVEDLLDVSRIVSGKVRLDVQPVDLSVVVTDAVATTRLSAEAKGIALTAAVDPRAGLVAGDPDRLRQVCWNLLSNAVKFTRRGGHIQVRVEHVQSHVEVHGQRHGHRPDAGISRARLRSLPAGRRPLRA